MTWFGVVDDRLQRAETPNNERLQKYALSELRIWRYHEVIPETLTACICCCAWSMETRVAFSEQNEVNGNECEQ